MNLVILLAASLTAPAHAVTTQWNNTGGGVFTDPFNWSNGVPDDNDIALFDSGFVAYAVDFPAGSIFDPPPNYFIYDLVIATNEVGFVWHSSPFFSNAPSLTVVDPSLSVVIGESSDDVSILNMAIGRLSGANASIGALAGATGTLNVGGTFNMSGALNIGESGTGTMNVAGGGTVVSANGFIGVNTGSRGQVTISGANSTWTISETLIVGGDRSGTVSIGSGGSVNSRDCELGSGGFGTGVVTVTGVGSTWTNSGNLTVGNEGDGHLTITDGGAVSSNTATIAADPFFTISGSSTVSVIGAGSTWTIGDAVTVGFTGSLTIADGGNVSNSEGFIGTAFSSFSPGTVTVTGAGSAWNMERLSIGNGTGGSGRLRIEPGGTVSVAQSIVLYEWGELFLQGGTLDAQTVSFQSIGGLFHFNSGTLHVDVYNGNLNNSGGTLAPGHSAGSTTINGNYTQQSAGKLEIQIDSPTSFDRLEITGSLTLGGTLKVELLDGYMPAAGASFDILDWGSLTGTFSTLQLPTLSGGLTWNTSQLYTDGALSVAAPGVPGDYNGNGTVDAADYVLWRKGGPLINEVDTPGTVNAADYTAWRARFGNTGSGSGSGATGSASVGVPEPASLALLLLAATFLRRIPR